MKFVLPDILITIVTESNYGDFCLAWFGFYQDTKDFGMKIDWPVTVIQKNGRIFRKTASITGMSAFFLNKDNTLEVSIDRSTKEVQQ